VEGTLEFELDISGFNEVVEYFKNPQQYKKKDRSDQQSPEDMRKANLDRMQGMSSSSASYAGRIKARIKPNFTLAGASERLEETGSVTVEIRTSPDGTIISRKVVASSGFRRLDNAVLQAIDRTDVLPRDQDGRVPPTINISFKINQSGVIESAEQSVAEEKQRLDPKCWDGYKKQGTKMKGGTRVNNCVPESAGYIARNAKEAQDPRFSASMTVDVGTDTMRKQLDAFFPTTAPSDGQEQIREADYHGRDVPLGRPMRGDVKKFKVYVKNKQGKVVKVNFGDPNMRIKKSNPARRKSFRARHNCSTPGPRDKARYWSCRKW
jgi:TonB family protein